MTIDSGAGVPDPFVLQRFVDAQHGCYDRVLTELRAGRKQTHWIWYIFPQLAGLGSSVMARRYAIATVDEARAYLAHDLLGPRLHECTRLVLAARARGAEDIFGRPDDLKVRSSMTLFARAGKAGGTADFTAVLDRYYGGREDAQTLRLIGIV